MARSHHLRDIARKSKPIVFSQSSAKQTCTKPPQKITIEGNFRTFKQPRRVGYASETYPSGLLSLRCSTLCLRHLDLPRLRGGTLGALSPVVR
jgi:hypothetical protein